MKPLWLWSRGVFEPEKLQEKLDELNKKSQDPELWNNKNEAQKILKEKAILDNLKKTAKKAWGKIAYQK